MDWIMDNWQVLWMALTTLVTLAVFVAKLTPTKKDDEIVGWVRSAVEWISQKVTTRPEPNSDA